MAEIDREELENKLMEKIAFGTIHLEHSKAVREKLKDAMQLIDSFVAEKEKAARIDGKIEAAAFIDGKLMADEPEIITSRRTEDEDNTWLKAQKVFSDYVSDDVIGSYVAELQNEREGNR